MERQDIYCDAAEMKNIKEIKILQSIVMKYFPLSDNQTLKSLRTKRSSVTYKSLTF